MSDRTARLTVVLDAHYYTDHIEALCDAIKLFAGVVSVKSNVSDPDTYAAETRVRLELEQKLWDALKEPSEKS